MIKAYCKSLLSHNVKTLLSSCEKVELFHAVNDAEKWMNEGQYN